MESVQLTKDVMKSLLKPISMDEGLISYDVDIFENAEKGEGFIGDIKFVVLSGITSTQQKKEISLFVKCSKSGKAVEENVPMNESFHNEIHMYRIVFPAFANFTIRRTSSDILTFIPKCYGIFAIANQKLVVLENLKAQQYEMWNRKKPMTLEMVDQVVDIYGKWHAVSLAFKDQEPQKFAKLANELVDVWGKINDKGHFDKLQGELFEETCYLLQGEVNGSYLNKWKSLGELHVFQYLKEHPNCVKVIAHKDCWNNNFLFNSERKQAVLLDFQMCQLASPVIDLSYFIYSCAANKDLLGIDDILKHYHTSLTKALRNLGSESSKLYTAEELRSDWKTFAKFGVIMGILGFKISQSDVRDVDQMEMDGRHVMDLLRIQLTDNSDFKERTLHILMSAVKTGVI